MYDSIGSTAVIATTDGPGDYERWEDHLPALLGRLGIPAYGVLQVGAHTGQEVEALTRCGFRRLVMMEPNPDHVAELIQRLRYHEAAGLPEPLGGLAAREVVPLAAGRERGEAVLHVTEYDQQASLLPPMSPLVVTRRETTPVIPVHEIQDGCNVMVVDVQGAEVEVLLGADLDRLDLAVIEGSAWPRYDGGSTLDDIAAHMEAHGWRRVAEWPHARPGVVDVAWQAPSSRHLSLPVS